MEPSSPIAVAGNILALFEPSIGGARSALAMCCASQTILRDYIAELELEQEKKQEPNLKQATVAATPREEPRLVECGSDPLLLVCSFLSTQGKARFRVSSLGLHSMLLGCSIDLTESQEIRKLATIEFVLERFAPFRLFSSFNRDHEACSCAVARTISGLGVGACLSLAGPASYDAAHLKAQSLQAIGFGHSCSVVGLSLMQESDAEMLPKLLTAIHENQIQKIAISSRSAGILTAIGIAVESGKLKGLQHIEFYFKAPLDYDSDELEHGYLGTLSNFGPAFHTLNLRKSQTVDISGLRYCQNLRMLDLSGTPLVDVSVLGSCSSLHTLNLRGTQVTDVSTLGSCGSLHKLDLQCTEVADVSALGLCSSLHTLDLFSTDVTDVSALGSCSSLHTLNLCDMQVTDVSALGSCSSLHTLDLRDTLVADVSALGRCKNLYTLDLNSTKVADVSALGSCSNLFYLDLNSTQVIDVSSLASCLRLNTLSIHNTAVSDTSALESTNGLFILR